jgi:hypothetical protein
MIRGIASERCPICGQTSQLIGHAFLAPWIAEILNLPPTTSSLQKCIPCNFLFFTYRFSDDEMKILYSDYRGAKYFAARKSWEFWYSKGINDFWLKPQNIKVRTARLQGTLESMGFALENTRSCLDYGGDEGQFIPKHIPREMSFVLDYSNKPSSSDYISITDVRELPSPVDLVLCCMTLEHVSLPMKLMRELMNSSSGYIYLEVPQDSFKVSRFHATRAYKNWLNLLGRSKILFISFDFISGLCRNFLGFIPWFGVIKQSEHINYFSEESIHRLASSFELGVKTKGFQGSSVGSMKLGQLSALLSKTDDISD